MKKNLFEISTEESQRILSLHESRSKSQYLNIINETVYAKGSYENPYEDSYIQSAVDVIVDTIDGYSNDGDMGSILSRLTALRFKAGWNRDNPTKPFKTTALSRLYSLYYDDEGIKLDDDVRNESGNGPNRKKLINFIQSTRKEKLVVPTKKAQTQLDIKYNHSFANGTFKITPGSIAKKFDNDNIFITTPDKKTIWFKCSTSKFSNNGPYVPEDNKQTELANKLLSSSFLCNKAKAFGPPPVDGQTPPVGGQTPPVGTKTQSKGSSSPKQKRYSNNTINYTKQVQQSLGNTTPTGKINDTDIDAILAKLAGNTPL